jgi:Lon protease-like protein
MTALERVETAASALKVFPLSSVVLFPGMAVPLHIFEARYRELVKDSLASNRVMAMSQPAAGAARESAALPALHTICCAGVIAWHEELAGGRYNIVVRGVARARISEELPARKQYREVRAEILGDPAFSGPEEEQLRQTVFELAGLLPHSFGQTVLQNAASASGGSLADAMAAALVIDLERRQQLLSELDVRRRLLGVVDEVGELIARLTPPKDTGPVN